MMKIAKEFKSSGIFINPGIYRIVDHVDSGTGINLGLLYAHTFQSTNFLIKLLEGRSI